MNSVKDASLLRCFLYIINDFMLHGRFHILR